LSALSEAQQSAIEAVARHFSAAWSVGEGPPDAYVTVGGRTIALDVAVVESPSLRRQRPGRARLRDDVVAQRVLRDLESALRAHVPDGKAAILTLGAPIQVPAKLVAALTTMLRTYLERGARDVDKKKTVLGNRVRFRVVNRDSAWNAKVIGFVFTGDPEPGGLENAMRALSNEIAAKAKRRLPRRFAGNRWLVLDSDHWIADIKTYRRACAHFPIPHTFRKILMVFNRRVDLLAES
jgi:hypothetical protein